MQIEFNPFPKQFQAWEYLTDTKTTELGYGGAAHGGKSYLGCFWLLAMCLAYPDTAWGLGRKELVNLRKTTLITLFKVCDQYGIKPERDFHYNRQDNIITFPNRSQIFLLDMAYKPSDPLYTRFGGLELTGAFIDESNEAPFKAVEILSTRLGRRNNEKYGLRAKVLETFNPEKNHVYSRYYKPWKDRSLPAHRQFLQALPVDNPYTPESYLDQLRNSDKTTKERLLYGNFEYDDDPAILIDHDAGWDIFTNTIKEEPDQKYITADIARFGKDKSVVWYWEGWRAKKRFAFDRNAIDEIADFIRTKSREYKVPYSHILIDEDGIGGGVVDILRGVKGFMARSAPVDARVGESMRLVRPNYGSIKDQCAFIFADKVNHRKVALDIDEGDLQEIIHEELTAIKRKDPEKESIFRIQPKDEQKELLGRSPDNFDGLMMRVWFELKKVESRPVRINRYNQYRPRNASHI